MKKSGVYLYQDWMVADKKVVLVTEDVDNKLEADNEKVVPVCGQRK